MSVARIARRYAKSLLDLAQERNSLEQIREDIASFANATKNRDFHMMLKSPIITTGKKKAIIHEIFGGKVQELTLAFYDLVLAKGRESFLPEISEAFEEQYRDLKKITTIKLTTATAVSEEFLATIKAKLEGSSNTKESVEIETAVNPDLIGGFVFEFGDQLYDASVAHRLAVIKKEFAK